MREFRFLLFTFLFSCCSLWYPWLRMVPKRYSDRLALRAIKWRGPYTVTRSVRWIGAWLWIDERGDSCPFTKKLICNHQSFFLRCFVRLQWGMDSFLRSLISFGNCSLFLKWLLNKAGRSRFSDFSLSLCRTNVAMIGRCRPCTFPSFYVLFGTVDLPLCPFLFLKNRQELPLSFLFVFCWFLLKFSLRERVWRSRRRSFRFMYSYFTRLSERQDSCP